MGKFHELIKPAHRDFIKKQHIFFVAAAPLDGNGHVNLSPKGLDCFRVLSDNRIAYMDLISSGNETSAHVMENGRITIMFCAFAGAPNILRLYGKGFTVLPGSPDWDTYAPHFTIYPSTRQIIVADITLVQTSCGYGVPLYEFVGDRDIHFDWAEAKGESGLRQYVNEKNLESLDGLATPLGNLAKGIPLD
ncbi:pyridoxamine 5'-phosphate oxidase family protein [Segetibacter sp. 3557_3]|uniref:pyridoxamine 5'-phosphate oxidase family protein n=1 Tax=Segetibacter sp. 3557_3 TaxID=2547429 RepID=UPI0010591ABF|nr:pyridoxamine 5'-phosphate oxidase family protein [Segetibacter sp. 3557_3]TDH23354.1 pyridoxamine 5'-phosphate oxidase family protein [Segetibacter sp. 3557_3]